MQIRDESGNGSPPVETRAHFFINKAVELAKSLSPRNRGSEAIHLSDLEAVGQDEQMVGAIRDEIGAVLNLLHQREELEQMQRNIDDRGPIQSPNHTKSRDFSSPCISPRRKEVPKHATTGGDSMVEGRRVATDEHYRVAVPEPDTFQADPSRFTQQDCLVQVHQQLPDSSQELAVKDSSLKTSTAHTNNHPFRADEIPLSSPQRPESLSKVKSHTNNTGFRPDLGLRSEMQSATIHQHTHFLSTSPAAKPSHSLQQKPPLKHNVGLQLRLPHTTNQHHKQITPFDLISRTHGLTLRHDRLPRRLPSSQNDTQSSGPSTLSLPPQGSRFAGDIEMQDRAATIHPQETNRSSQAFKNESLQHCSVNENAQFESRLSPRRPENFPLHDGQSPPSVKGTQGNFSTFTSQEFDSFPEGNQERMSPHPPELTTENRTVSPHRLSEMCQSLDQDPAGGQLQTETSSRQMNDSHYNPSHILSHQQAKAHHNSEQTSNTQRLPHSTDTHNIPQVSRPDPPKAREISEFSSHPKHAQNLQHPPSSFSGQPEYRPSSPNQSPELAFIPPNSQLTKSDHSLHTILQESKPGSPQLQGHISPKHAFSTPATHVQNSASALHGFQHANRPISPQQSTAQLSPEHAFSPKIATSCPPTHSGLQNRPVSPPFPKPAISLHSTPQSLHYSAHILQDGSPHQSTGHLSPQLAHSSALQNLDLCVPSPHSVLQENRPVPHQSRTHLSPKLSLSSHSAPQNHTLSASSPHSFLHGNRPTATPHQSSVHLSPTLDFGSTCQQNQAHSAPSHSILHENRPVSPQPSRAPLSPELASRSQSDCVQSLALHPAPSHSLQEIRPVSPQPSRVHHSPAQNLAQSTFTSVLEENQAVSQQSRAHLSPELVFGSSSAHAQNLTNFPMHHSTAQESRAQHSPAHSVGSQNVGPPSHSTHHKLHEKELGTHQSPEFAFSSCSVQNPAFPAPNMLSSHQSTQDHRPISPHQSRPHLSPKFAFSPAHQNIAHTNPSLVEQSSPQQLHPSIVQSASPHSYTGQRQCETDNLTHPFSTHSVPHNNNPSGSYSKKHSTQTAPTLQHQSAYSVLENRPLSPQPRAQHSLESRSASQHLSGMHFSTHSDNQESRRLSLPQLKGKSDSMQSEGTPRISPRETYQGPQVPPSSHSAYRVSQHPNPQHSRTETRDNNPQVLFQGKLNNSFASGTTSLIRDPYSQSSGFRRSDKTDSTHSMLEKTQAQIQGQSPFLHAPESSFQDTIASPQHQPSKEFHRPHQTVSERTVFPPFNSPSSDYHPAPSVHGHPGNSSGLPATPLVLSDKGQAHASAHEQLDLGSPSSKCLLLTSAEQHYSTRKASLPSPDRQGYSQSGWPVRRQTRKPLSAQVSVVIDNRFTNGAEADTIAIHEGALKTSSPPLSTTHQNIEPGDPPQKYTPQRRTSSQRNSPVLFGTAVPPPKLISSCTILNDPHVAFIGTLPE
ncbi:hypothetical protein DIPPA_50148 [Diplonema papillatum]|nr:hypothetical protein DIPPA_50148 [Diplonema papillatum]